MNNENTFQSTENLDDIVFTTDTELPIDPEQAFISTKNSDDFDFNFNNQNNANRATKPKAMTKKQRRSRTKMTKASRRRNHR